MQRTSSVHADHLIAEIARGQYGLISVAQAATHEVSIRQLQRRCDSGQLVAVRRGVLRVAGAPPCWEQSALAATLAGGPDTLVSHAAAARVWGANRFARALVEVSEPRGCSADLDDVRTHRSTVLAIDRRTSEGLPLTSPERTIVDLSGRLDATSLGRPPDDWIRRKLMTAESLAVCAARLRPARGRRMSIVHKVLERRLPGYEPGDSPFSERVAQVLEHLAGLPDVVRQYPVLIGNRTYHIDTANPSVLLAHESDGWDSHRTRSAFYIDRARANDLVSIGWTVLRYTYEMTDEEIARIARTTYDRLRERAS